MRAAPDPEDGALRRARRVITAQIAAAVALLGVVIGAVAYTIMVSGQHAETDRLLARTIGLGLAATPPGCVTLYTPAGHTPPREPPPPGGALPNAAALVPRPGDVLTQRPELGGLAYTVRLENRGGVVSQAFYNERYQQADRRSLLVGLAAAEAVALLGAVVTGRVLAGRAIRPLGDALRRQRRFVADASHELRAPLTRVHTRVQLLARRGRDDPRFDEELGLLATGTRQLGEVVQDLLVSAQLSTGSPRLELVELGTLADEAVAAEHQRAEAHGLALRVLRDGGPHRVRGVPTALRRVLSALLDNAIEHTPPGGRIEVVLDVPDPRHVRLAVRDTGEGFEPHQAQRLFERFARAAPGDGRRFGLGLALAREVVTGHGGTIDAAGSPGAGATFTLSFASAGS